MAKARVGTGLVAGCLLLGSAASAWAAPTAAQILNFRPKQEGVLYSTPTPQEMEACRVEAVKGKGVGAGWLLRDPRGLPLRRFFDTRYVEGRRGTGIDIWSYYKDGVEVYREVDSDNDGKVDQYRWLNTGGMKWGIDRDGDGKIDSWKAISPEELSQELLQAVITRDQQRFQALLLVESDLKALDLPPAEITRIRDTVRQASAKFQSAAEKLAGLEGKARWIHLETTPPYCRPAEGGAKQELITHPRATILFDGAGKGDWLQTGEMIQIGMAWRLIDGPSPGQGSDLVGDNAGPGPSSTVDKETQRLLDQLHDLDTRAPANDASPTAMAQYQLRRAAVLEEITGRVKPEEKEQWLRQVADCYSAAAQAGDKSAYDRLTGMAKDSAKNQQGSALAGYITFREMQADYSMQLAQRPSDINKIQSYWLERLAKFVQDYPKADDTPDALLQLGMVSEFLGKETEAKNWYDQLARNFADKKALADKARGARTRLDLEGKVLELTGPVLGTNQTFDIERLRGKAVIVYYWDSTNGQCVGDFAKLKLLLDSYGRKGLELVGVSLDSKPEDAIAFLRQTGAPGTHLHQPGGPDSPLATQYGVIVLPNMFLVGKDGKVISRSVQAGTVEDELRKLLN
ncbi:MAG TPA: thioredoxin-like domain-containing protein [Gemmataceae bacterium]|nr:thioredoxin-like domain-containing protein [Gemmataceae bacterium]